MPQSSCFFEVSILPFFSWDFPPCRKQLLWLAEWLERLTPNAEVLGSITNSQHPPTPCNLGDKIKNLKSSFKKKIAASFAQFRILRPLYDASHSQWRLTDVSLTRPYNMGSNSAALRMCMRQYDASSTLHSLPAAPCLHCAAFLLPCIFKLQSIAVITREGTDELYGDG